MRDGLVGMHNRHVSVLPDAGVTYYDVPQRFGATPYRYTVINGATVLVET